MRIRQGAASDAPAIHRLIQQLARAESFSSPLGAEYVPQCLAHPGYVVLVAEEDGQAVGLLSYLVRPNLLHAANACLLEELVVDQAWRERGVGSMLLEELISRAASLGCAEIAVAVMPGNERAIRFYRRHGLRDEVVLLERHPHP